MNEFDAQLKWIEEQRARMETSIETWCAINSGSRHAAGIEEFSEVVIDGYAGLEANVQRVALPSYESVDDNGEKTIFETAPALVFQKRPDAPQQVLLTIHLDTVFPETSPFQSVTRLDAHRLGGPGVADAKGGIALIGIALEALERDPAARHLGWTVILNPDEEVGSPCSMGLLAERATQSDFGLVFEPCLPDGSMISERKGSGNFAIVVRGRTAHVGRAFDEGRHAIHALADLVGVVSEWNHSLPGVIANTGIIRGGSALNVVPDFAMARINLRIDDAAQQTELSSRLEKLRIRIQRKHDVEVEIQGAFLSPPKRLEPRMESLMREVEETGRRVGVEIGWQKSGGVCDGNKLARAGLPNVDTMGPQGGAIHSEDEYLLLDSLVPRTQLCASLLHRYATGEFTLGDCGGIGGFSSSRRECDSKSEGES